MNFNSFYFMFFYRPPLIETSDRAAYLMVRQLDRSAPVIALAPAIARPKINVPT